VFISSIANQAFGQLNNSASRLVTTLDTFYVKHPIEKIHIHTDKPYYALGDTIWFKTYVVAGSRNVPSKLSGALYVDLIDPTDSIINTVKLPLINGLAKGSLLLPEGLNEGNFHIRAYTQWMCNAGTDFFYQQAFPVGGIKKNGIEANVTFLSSNEEKGVPRLIKLHFTNSDQRLPVANKPVNYTLRTSTQYYTGKGITTDQGDLLINMHGNEGKDSSYIIQSSLVLDTKIIKQHFKLRNPIADSVEIAFFPEGGTFVAGLPQRIAIKATGPNGKGIAVHGEVQNSIGERLAIWDTEHAGMGTFSLTPVQGEKYQVVIRFPGGSEKQYELPRIETSGHTLAVYSETDTNKVLVRLQATPNAYGPLLILAQHNGEVVFSKNIDQRRPLVQLYISRHLFPAGINQFTVFDQAGNPLAERIAFFQPSDTMKIIASQVAPAFTRDSVHIHLTISNNDSATFTSLSVAVTDESKAPIADGQENTIFTQLLLKSDLRGYIEDPAYYFTAVNQQKRDHLDLLLMTQGYRHFEWKAFATNNIPEPKYAPEPLLQHISGTLLTLQGKPVKNGKITLLSNRLGTYLDTITDAQGRFRFDNLLIQDSLAFTLQGRTPKGSDKVEIRLDARVRPPINQLTFSEETHIISENLKTYLSRKTTNDNLSTKLFGKHILNEVEVTAMKNQYLNIRGVSIPLKQLDRIIHPKASDSSKTLLECIRLWEPEITFGFIDRSRDNHQTNIRPIDNRNNRAKRTMPINNSGADLSGSGMGNITAMQYQNERLQRQLKNGLPELPILLSGGKEVQVLYNGFPIYGDTLSYLLQDRKAFDPNNIKAIYIKKYTGTGAAIAFTDMGQIDTRSFLYIETKDGLMYPPSPRWDYILVRPQGYSLVREFYSPRYDRGPEEAKLADSRSTIYWDPDIQVDKNGQATFGYFNASTPGIYRVVIEGINSRGQIGRKVFRYMVEER